MMNKDNILYGSDESLLKVSFAYGTLEDAAADDYPGGIAFGYDSETNAGAVYRMGELVSSRILDIILSDTSTSNVKLLTVKYVTEDGTVDEHKFNAADESLIVSLESRIDSLEDNPLSNYSSNDYIDISTNSISLKYSDLYTKVKSDLISEDFNHLNIYIGTGYIDVTAGEEENEGKDVISLNYDDIYTKIKSDLNAEGIIDQREQNETQDNRLTGIEMSYTNDASINDVSDANMLNVQISVKKRTSEDEDFVDSSISFNVPTSQYYEDVSTNIDSLDGRVSGLEETADTATYIEWTDISDLLEKENS